MNNLGSYLLGPNDTKKNGVYIGDAKELTKNIPDESVDLILTDPVYDKIDDYLWLSEAAVRILKNNRACLTYIGTGYAPRVHDALRKFLSYRWRLTTKPVFSVMFYGKLGVASQECLWYEKGKTNMYQMVYDCEISTKSSKYNVEGANWGKGADITARYIRAFTKAGDIVVDFFCGGGTIPAVCKQLGRKYLAFEIKPEIAQLARERVRDAQPPLFVQKPEQLGLL